MTRTVVFPWPVAVPCLIVPWVIGTVEIVRWIIQ